MYLRVFILLTGLSMGLALSPVCAGDYDVRTYNRDMETLKTELFETLNQQFSGTDNDAHWRVYMKNMLDRAGAIQDQISPLTYGMMRDAALTMGQNFSEYNQDGKWSDAEYHMKTVLDLIGRILSYREAGD
jgi:hypothetical protein